MDVMRKGAKHTQNTIVTALLVMPSLSWRVRSSSKPLCARASIKAGQSWRSVENAHSSIAKVWHAPQQTSGMQPNQTAQMMHNTASLVRSGSYK